MPGAKHLDSGEIRDFLLGKLSEQRSAIVAAHLDTCSACEATATSLDRCADPLILQIVAPEAVDEYAHEAELQRALEGAKHLDASAMAAVPDAAILLPKRIGEYLLLEKLGEGGMGAVFKATHLRLDRTVAVKILSIGRLHSPQAVARFDREMRAIGKLEHPNLIRATDAGEIDGTQYLVMEYLEGSDLSRLSKRCQPLKVADVCELVRQAAVGLQFAHEHDLVHRDVKPSNIMLTPTGQVKVLDLGLARLQSQSVPDGDLTSSGCLIGTIDYMAPEQCNNHRVDFRADVYSLGATLYSLLAGRSPFGGPEYEGLSHKLIALASEKPVPLSERRPDIPPALSALVDRLLAKRPELRLSTSAEVGAALKPFTAGHDLLALWSASLRSQVATPRDNSGGSATTHSGAMSGSLDTAFPLERPAPSSPPAQLAREPVPGTRRQVHRRWLLIGAAGFFLSAAALAWLNIKDDTSLARVNEPRMVVSDTAESPQASAAKLQPAKSHTEHVAAQSKSVVPSLVSPNGWLEVIPLIDVRSDAIYRGPSAISDPWTSENGNLLCSTGACQAKIRIPAEIDCSDFEVEVVLTRVDGNGGLSIDLPTPRGTLWVSVGRDATLPIATGKRCTVRVRLAIAGANAHVIVYIDDELLVDREDSLNKLACDFLLSMLDDRTGSVCVDESTSVIFHSIRLRPHAGTLRLNQPLPAASPLPAFVSVAPLRGLLPSPARNVCPSRWQVYSAEPLSCTAAAWSPDGRWIACGENSGLVRLYSADDLRLRRLLVGHTSWISALSWSPDSKRFASSSGDHNARLWSTDGAELGVLRGHALTAQCVAWSPDGQRIATAGSWNDYLLRIWTADGVPIWSRQIGPIEWICWDPIHQAQFLRLAEGPCSYVAQDDGPLRSVGPKQPSSAIGIGHHADSIAFGRSADLHGPYIQLWDTRTEKKIAELNDSNAQVWPNSIAFSSDDKYLATAGQDAWVRVWDLGSKQLVKSHFARDCAGHVSWDETDRQLAYITADGLLGVCSAFQDGAAKTLGSRRSTLRQISPNGRQLAVTNATEDDEIVLTSLDGTHDLPVSRQVVPGLTGLFWSPDGNSLIACPWQDARLVDALTGQVTAHFKGHTKRVCCVAWSRDEDCLATGEEDQTIRLWNRGGTCSRTLSDQPGIPKTLALSPTGQWLAAGYRGHPRNVRLWDAVSGKPGPALGDSDGDVRDLYWASDTRLLVFLDGGKFQTWRIAADQATSKGLDDAIELVPSPGTPEHPWLLVVDEDRHHRLRQLGFTRQLNLQHLPHGAEPRPGTASPDGKEISLWCADGRLYTWSTESGELLKIVVLLPHRQLVTFSPSGDILSQTADAEAELVYAVEQADGSLQIQSRAEFLQRPND